MSIIAWIVLGAIAGYLAGLLVRGDESLGIIGHVVLGIVGALVGGFLATVFLNTNPIDGPFDISSIVTATIGAILVVVIVAAVQGGRAPAAAQSDPSDPPTQAQRPPRTRWAFACPARSRTDPENRYCQGRAPAPAWIAERLDT